MEATENAAEAVLASSEADGAAINHTQGELAFHTHSPADCKAMSMLFRMPEVFAEAGSHTADFLAADTRLSCLQGIKVFRVILHEVSA